VRLPEALQGLTACENCKQPCLIMLVDLFDGFMNREAEMLIQFGTYQAEGLRYRALPVIENDVAERLLHVESSSHRRVLQGLQG
jgi:hypothetical protein